MGLQKYASNTSELLLRIIEKENRSLGHRKKEELGVKISFSTQRTTFTIQNKYECSAYFTVENIEFRLKWHISLDDHFDFLLFRLEFIFYIHIYLNSKDK